MCVCVCVDRHTSTEGFKISNRILPIAYLEVVFCVGTDVTVRQELDCLA